MARIRNQTDSDLSVAPLDRRIVAPDELVEVDDEVFQQYEWPADTWSVEDAPADPRTAAELRKELERRGLPTSGKKAELVRRLDEEPGPVVSAPVITPENGE